ncbi:MAG TPA: PepSY domain-containing protein [Candidatus Dormibacteraeota bacterium]|nr:PepSY domain-containing protein [Candidatus Dormibacteraeota bacterium]
MNRSKQSLVLLLVTAFAIVLSHPAMAATKHHPRATRPKISLKQARTTALAKVPGGKVAKHELERENGKLIYSFDIRVPKQSGVEEVQVDAMTGEVVSQTHESAVKERKEAHQEQTESRKDSLGTPGH